MPSNGIATADDFRIAVQQSNPAERVVLPKSGLAVLLRRPTTFAVWMLDQELAEVQESGVRKQTAEGTTTDSQEPTTNKYVEWRAIIRRAVEEAFVQPKLSLTPGPNEIHPSWLPDEDQVFILRWVRGLIAPDGTDLVEKFFRTTPRPPSQRGGEPGLPLSVEGGAREGAAAGAGGGNPALPAVEPARSDRGASIAS